MQLTRQRLAEQIRSAVEPLDYIHAMWEGGSAAFGRDDEFSDLDLQLDVDDERIAEAFAAVEAALNELSPIELQYNIPEPAWHGMSQRFYKLRDAAPYLLVDLAIRKASDRQRFNEVELHGVPVIYFDKPGVVVSTHLDAAEHEQKLRKRFKDLQILFPLFQGFIEKEIRRDNALGALHYYHAMTLRPLCELAQMIHCPARYNYSAHYAKFELPEDLLGQLVELSFISDLAALDARRMAAAELFGKLVAQLENRLN